MRPAAVACSLLSLITVGALAGCPDRSISEVTPVQGRVEAKDIPVTVNRDVDILFVIDDSPSMADKQANLARNFKNFTDVLETIQGGLPNVHIGVVTSDMGSHGADGKTAPGIGTLGQGGCANLGKSGNLQAFSAPIRAGQVYLSNVSGSPNYDGSLSAAFAEMAKAGAGGCGFEQHLEAMKAALEPTNAVNQGFLRPNAYLAVVFIADEDDCSMQDAVGLLANENPTLGPQQSFRCTRFGVTCDDNGATPNAMNVTGPKGKCHPNEGSQYLTHIDDYVKFLKGLKDDPLKVIVAGIIGTSEPFAVELRAPPRMTTKVPALAHSCTYVGADGTEVADPPIRLRFFLDQFPNRSTFSTICQNDLSGGLQQIGDLLKTVIGDPCIEGKLADVDPNTPGDQFDCSVSTVTNPGSATTRTETIMPKCTPENDQATNKPCWHLAIDTDNCKKNDHRTLRVEGQESLPSDTHVVANCVTEITDN
jgi:hypothetical protein